MRSIQLDITHKKSLTHKMFEITKNVQQSIELFVGSAKINENFVLCESNHA